RSLTTLQRLDSGDAAIGGADVGTDPAGARRAFGYAGQESALDNVKKTGTGQPGLSATYLTQLEGILERWARAEPDRPLAARASKTRNRVPTTRRELGRSSTQSKFK
ncbi:MAG TPA: hypothetical protein VJ921_06810, partial [Vicinamibacteria bacterium]|nr:hypothetical protein [Vicinamibacteria bacterium]